MKAGRLIKLSLEIPRCTLEEQDCPEIPGIRLLCARLLNFRSSSLSGGLLPDEEGRRAVAWEFLMQVAPLFRGSPRLGPDDLMSLTEKDRAGLLKVFDKMMSMRRSLEDELSISLYDMGGGHNRQYLQILERRFRNNWSEDAPDEEGAARGDGVVHVVFDDAPAADRTEEAE